MSLAAKRILSMKILPVNQNYRRNNDVNFSATAVLGRDIKTLRKGCHVIELTDASLYEDVWPGFRELIITSVQRLQQEALGKSDIGVLRKFDPEDIKPHLFLFDEDKGPFIDALRAADDEIANEPSSLGIRETFIRNWQERKGACGVLRCVVEGILNLAPEKN